nr:MAG TPA: hypothetical protein [Caudoviricetes sp.]
MPNLVLEYNGQTYRFGLTTNADLTNGQNIKVPFNGSELYARIGDDNTPLKVIKNGRTYSVQYNPAAFNNIYVDRPASDRSEWRNTVFFPTGNYRITIDGSSRDSREIRINDNRNLEIVMSIVGYNDRRLNLTISGYYDRRVPAGSNRNKFSIERIGD